MKAKASRLETRQVSCVFNDLHGTRGSFYGCFGRCANALFEPSLTAVNSPSSVHPSLAPVHRHGWGNLYAALSKGRIDEEALRNLLGRHSLARSRAGAIPGSTLLM